MQLCQAVSAVAHSEVDPKRVTTAQLGKPELLYCTCSLTTFGPELEVEFDHNRRPKGERCSVSLQR